MMTTGKQPPRFTISITDLETGEVFTHENLEGLILVAGKSKPDEKGFETFYAMHGAPKIILPIVLGWNDLGKEIRERVAKSVAEGLFRKNTKADDSDIPDAVKKMFGMG